MFLLTEWTDEIQDPLIQVQVQFGRDSFGTCYEAIAPLGNTSPVLRTLRVGDRILNHVAYLVTDLSAERERVRDCGCVLAGDPYPAVAYGGRRVQFFVSPLRFMIELIEAPMHQHSFIT